jgi:hypothetical protein
MGKKYYDPAYDGTWPIMEATTFKGQAYTGTMRISPAAKDGHRIDWKTSAGNYDGIGLVIDGRLLLAFGKAEDGYGLAIYAETAAGIEAVFTSLLLQGEVGIEKVPGCPGFAHLDQMYDMQGQQGKKGSYTGKIAFVPHGELYLATWAFEGTTGQYGGVCMLRHGKLIASYGLKSVYSFGAGCYELQPDGTLRGEWAIPSAETIGREVYGLRAQGE